MTASQWKPGRGLALTSTEWTVDSVIRKSQWKPGRGLALTTVSARAWRLTSRLNGSPAGGSR